MLSGFGGCLVVGMKTSTSEKLAVHILPTSATMVGVCLTAIGLAKLVEQSRGASNIDEFLALDSVLFCVATLLSYSSIRWVGRRRAARYERIADYIFSVGMVAMVVICVLFAFDLG